MNNELLNKIMQTKSIQNAIQNGEYSFNEAIKEFSDQLNTKDIKNGLLLVDDLATDVKNELLSFIK